MGRKRTPTTSKITRGGTIAYARKQTKSGEGDDADVKDASKLDPKKSEAKDAPAAAPEQARPGERAQDSDRVKTAPASPAKDDRPAAAPAAAPPLGEGPKSATRNEPPTSTDLGAPAAPKPAPAGSPEPAAPRPGDGPKSAAGNELPTTPEPTRARVETVTMPAEVVVGQPPEIPATAIIGDTRAVEDPTAMPGPTQIPPGNPQDVAAPPGVVPRGDSRSFRKRGDAYEFALVYRQGTAVISRFGVVGTRGQWRVVEYPTPQMASNAYAKECSRFVSEGFSDYRD